MTTFVNFSNRKIPISVGTKVIVIHKNTTNDGAYAGKISEIYTDGNFKVQLDNRLYPSIFNNNCKNVYNRDTFIAHIGELAPKRTQLKRVLFKKRAI